MKKKRKQILLTKDDKKVNKYYLPKVIKKTKQILLTKDRHQCQDL